MAEEKSGEVIPSGESSQERQLELFEELVAVEKARIESTNQRTEVMRLAVEANDRSDEREYNFHMQRLENEAVDSARRYKFGSRFFLSVGGASIALVAFLVYMAFYGAEIQSGMAIRILQLLFAALAGYGLLSALVSAAKRFFFRGTPE